jgi:hypothetical protein
MRYMKELSRMVKAVKEIAFRNAIVVEIEKRGNHCLVEKVLKDGRWPGT